MTARDADEDVTRLVEETRKSRVVRLRRRRTGLEARVDVIEGMRLL